MSLDDSQRKTVTTWIDGGLKLSEIQTRLASELGVKLTYMEVRLLVDDLKLTPKDPEPPARLQTIGTTTAPESDSSSTSSKVVEAAPSPAGGVSVSVDHLARPGAIVSGKVTFSDGQRAEWYLDQMGRLGVVAAQKGYKPTAADVQEFQQALQDELAKMGM